MPILTPLKITPNSSDNSPVEQLNVPRLMVAGIAPGDGVSWITVGMLQEFIQRGIAITPLTSHVAPVTSAVLRRLSGRTCWCLDGRLLSPAQQLVAAWFASRGSELLLIEAGGGILEGDDVTSFESVHQQVARLLHLDPLLVGDAARMKATFAAVVKGVSSGLNGVRSAGVIANRSPWRPAEAEGIRSLLDREGLPPLLGELPHVAGEWSLPSGDASQAGTGAQLSRQMLLDVHRQVRERVALDRVVEIASEPPSIALPQFHFEPASLRVRIAVADDAAFQFLFQENIELLRYYGAEIVPFSPLGDVTLPDEIQAIYLPGAFLSAYAAELDDNQAIRWAIRDAVERGVALYSEGAGTAFLCESYVDTSGATHAGVGLLQCSARAVRGVRHYATTTLRVPALLGEEGDAVEGVLYNDWRLVSEKGVRRVARMSFRGTALTVDEGLTISERVFATFAINHFGSAPEVARTLVENCTALSLSDR